MVATYAGTLAVCAASLAIGQAAIRLCGARRWSWLSPAVGLALLCALCWGMARLPGDGRASAFAAFALTVVALAYLRGRVDGAGKELPTGLAVGALALAAASLPFAVEGHFGILGTGFDPDMSQHLLAADRLAHGEGSQLLHQGYPLGPHAIVLALNKGLGIGLVQGFDGLTVAVAVLAPLTALAAFSERPRWLRVAAALVVGLAYMVASYYAQGSFKETMQALFVLAFVLALRESTRPEWRDLPLRFVPAALIAVGSVYAYSYPGLVWLVAAAAIWALIELARSRFAPSAGGVGSGPAALRSVLLAGLVFVVLIAPEIGRMIEFHNFETFDPNGPGLGNLFGQVSPFEALGIWPSGDFRLSPGDGAVPALGYYLGAAFASILLVYGLVLCWRRRETAVVAGVLAAIAVYVVARVAGTPYTTAKGVEVAAPIAALAIVLPLARRPAGLLYMLAAGGCALLALANAPVGPTAYSPALTGLRPLVADGSTLVLASTRLLDEEHGERYIIWELRGGRVCIEAATAADRRVSSTAKRPPPGVRFVVTENGARQPPFAGMRLRRAADPYLLWETVRAPRGKSDCPLIAVRQARAGTPFQ
jgi:hypothetical protein